MSVASHPKPLSRDPEKRWVIQVDTTDPHWDAVVMAGDATVVHHSGWLAAPAHD